MQIIDFIKTTPNWRELLIDEPYNLIAKIRDYEELFRIAADRAELKTDSLNPRRFFILFSRI